MGIYQFILVPVCIRLSDGKHNNNNQVQQYHRSGIFMCLFGPWDMSHHHHLTLVMTQNWNTVVETSWNYSPENTDAVVATIATSNIIAAVGPSTLCRSRICTNTPAFLVPVVSFGTRFWFKYSYWTIDLGNDFYNSRVHAFDPTPRVLAKLHDTALQLRLLYDTGMY